MVWTQLVVLPQASVAVQVRWIGGRPMHVDVAILMAREASPKVIVTFGSQPSVAVGVPVTSGSTDVPHSTVTSGGQVSTGGVVSRIWSWRVQVVTLPSASVCRSVT